MSRPASRVGTATVVAREVLTEHLVRVVLDAPGFVGTGVPDEWVAVTVPGQFQTRYYTIGAHEGSRVTLDVVIHEEGLVTRWAQTDCVGDEVGLSAPKGSYDPPEDAEWVVLAGDLTALPAMARIARVEQRPVQALVEAPAGTEAAYPLGVTTTWHDAPGHDSRLAALVRDHAFPEGQGYFWMAGESAQMRDVRRWARQSGAFDTRHMDAMGYWSGARGRQTRRVDPGPIYARGRAQGKTDEQIWADYDAARSEGER